MKLLLERMPSGSIANATTPTTHNMQYNWSEAPANDTMCFFETNRDEACPVSFVGHQRATTANLPIVPYPPSSLSHSPSFPRILPCLSPKASVGAPPKLCESLAFQLLRFQHPSIYVNQEPNLRSLKTRRPDHSVRKLRKKMGERRMIYNCLEARVRHFLLFPSPRSPKPPSQPNERDPEAAACANRKSVVES